MIKLLLDWLSANWFANWFTIFCTILGMGSSYWLYKLQKKGAASAAAERKKHALNELRDVVESYIINKQLLTEQIIQNLIRATERDHAVSLRPQYKPISILQDVELRLQRSRYLDISQKSEYSEKIENLIKSISELSSPVRIDSLDSEITAKLQELEPFFIPDSRQEAKNILTELTSLMEKKNAFSKKAEDAKDRMSGILWALVGGGVAGFLSKLLVMVKSIHFFDEEMLSSIFVVITSIFIGSLSLLLLMAYLVRLKRNTKEDSNIGTKES